MVPKDFTPQEQLIALCLTSFGIRYEEQQFFDPYTVDFWIPSLGMIIEADGVYGHFRKRDEKRDAVLMTYPEIESVVHVEESTKPSVEKRLWEVLS